MNEMKRAIKNSLHGDVLTIDIAFTFPKIVTDRKSERRNRFT